MGSCWFCGSAALLRWQFRFCFGSLGDEYIDDTSLAAVCGAHKADAEQLHQVYVQWRYLQTLRVLLRALEAEEAPDRPLIDEQRRRYDDGQLLFDALLTMNAEDARAWVEAQKESR